MRSHLPTSLDFLALVLRLITKIIALILIYNLSVRSEASSLIILAILLSEIYEIGALLVVLYHPDRRQAVYSLVALINTALVFAGLYVTQALTTDAYLLGLLLLMGGAISGGWQVGVLVGVVSGLAFGLINWLILSHTGGEVLLQSLVFPYAAIVAGLLSTRFYQNLNEQNRLEDEMNRLEEASELREKFTAVIASNLHTPLVSVQGYLDLLKQKAVVDPVETRKIVDRVIAQVRDLERQMEQLIDLASLVPVVRPDKLETIEVRKMIKIVLEQCQQNADLGQTGIKLNEHLSEQVWIDVDGRAMRQAICHLVESAVSLTPGGGQVEITVIEHPKNIEILVRNKGAALAQQKIDQLFTHWYRSGDWLMQNQEFGLGLYMAKSIIEAHGGSLTVQSRDKKGTTFIVQLPRSESKSSRSSLRGPD